MTSTAIHETAPAGPLPIADARTTAAHFFAALSGSRARLIGVVALLVAAAALGLVMPWALGRIVDIAIDGGDAGDVWRLAILMVVATVAGAGLTGAGVAASAQLFETVLARLRERMLASALRLPFSRVEAAGSGDLVSRATDDVEVVSTAISQGVPAISTSVFTIAATVVGLAALDWRFLAVVVVVLPVHIFTVRRYVREAPPVYTGERAAMAKRAHEVLGAIRGLDSARAFGLTGRLLTEIEGRSWGVVRWTLRARVVQNRFFAGINLAEFVGMATILVVGYMLVGNEGLTVGAATAAMLFFLRLFGPIGELLMVTDDLQSAAASLVRIVGVTVEGERFGSDRTAAASTPVPQGRALEAQDITFAYPGKDPVLDGVSLTIADGEHVALVGASGAGKTTLAAVLAGIHRPVRGAVRFGGADLAELDESERARRVALVTQETHVFAGSLADDLRMAAPDATDEQIRDALRRIHAWEWVELLPDGIETIVGDGGHDLSPMQVQQVALARLVLLDPALVILDEATADAGSAGASLLEASAEAALEGRSALIVAHRLSQAATADRIVLMDRGAIVEQGSHDALLRSGGRYATLWAAWARGRAES
ncbi:ABC transporter ATP-binding protein/permease [Rhodococcus sp. HM1]|uniref:ABC transporter ATP-binding protein n=1 Tax=Rhodococcus sp. HM1 TaxID=2937759 RepID=UPI00200A9BF9|nr:ABC transporter ATP-binding protein [Rhodococcus sp. HM1]MCK8674886.1 ABC transporter ATP-binding protein/permease [Rhodococcus sp. HM1]